MKTRTRVGTPLLIAAVALGAPPDRAHAETPPIIGTTTVPALVEVHPFEVTTFSPQPGRDAISPSASPLPSFPIVPTIPNYYVVRVTDQALLDTIVARTDPDTGAFGGYILGRVDPGSFGFNRNSFTRKAWSWHLSGPAVSDDLPPDCGVFNPDLIERDIRRAFGRNFCSGSIQQVIIRADTSTPGDIDINGKVGLQDYKLLERAFTGPTRRCWQASAADDSACMADLDGDGRVDVRDGLILRDRWQGLSLNKPDVFEIVALDKDVPSDVPRPGALIPIDIVDVQIKVTDGLGRTFGHGLPALKGTAAYEARIDADLFIDDGVQFVSNARGIVRVRVERQPNAIDRGSVDLLARINGEEYVLARDVAIAALPASFEIAFLSNLADVDEDGVVTAADLTTFYNLYVKGEADLSGDGRTDYEDLSLYLDAYQAQ